MVLLGGSALSPWAIQRDPFMVKRRVAEQTGCSDDVEAEDIAPCLRLRNLEELLAVQLDPPRFTSGFAPFVDGAVMPPPINQVSDVRKTRRVSLCDFHFPSTDHRYITRLLYGETRYYRSNILRFNVKYYLLHLYIKNYIPVIGIRRLKYGNRYLFQLFPRLLSRRINTERFFPLLNQNFISFSFRCTIR